MKNPTAISITLALTFTSTLALAAKPKPNSCAEHLILTAAKKHVASEYKNRPNSGGYCALGVRKSLQLSKVGKITGGLGNAIDYVRTLPPKGFIDNRKRDPKTAPPGSVIVFSGPKTAEYLRTGKFGRPAGDWVGHVTIKGDDGYYYTDGRTAEAAIGWVRDRNVRKKRNVAAIFVPGPELVAAHASKCFTFTNELAENMKMRSLFLASVIASATSAWAEAKPMTSKDGDAAVRITGDLQKLSFLSKSDQEKGRHAVVPALEELEKFMKLPKDDPRRIERLEAIVNLAREVVPYDVEGQLAQSLAKELMADRTLRGGFERMMDSMRSQLASKVDRCKTEALNALIQETFCHESSGIKGQDYEGEGPAESCTQAFNYEQCLTVQ